MAEQFFTAALFIATVMFIAMVLTLLDEFCRPASRQKRGRFVPWLEWLGKLILPSASPYYYWDPTSGDNVDANAYVGGQIEYVNWDVGTMGSHTHPALLPSSSGADTIFFDGSSGINGHGQEYNGNQPCNVDVNLTGNVQLQNGYNSQITIGDDLALNMYGYQDNDPNTDNFLVAFAGPNSLVNVPVGSAVMGPFNWLSGGKATVNGGAVIIGNGANLNQSTASPLIINSGTVYIGNQEDTGNSTFNLTNGSADINVNPNGNLIFYAPYSSNNGAILVDNQRNAALISNNGSTSLTVDSQNTSPGGASINAPFDNHAYLYATSGGSWSFQRADTSGNDLSMDAGEISLGRGTNLYCSHQYTQTGGTLEITDGSGEGLLVAAAGGGAANFNGGKILFDGTNPDTSGYGILSVNNVIFNGAEIDMRISGINTGASDLIKCVLGNTCVIKGNSKLVVTAVNPVQKGFTWTLITPTGNGNNITGDFLPANITLPANVVETAGALPNAWKCNS